jgi:hypothetical protein
MSGAIAPFRRPRFRVMLSEIRGSMHGDAIAQSGLGGIMSRLKIAVPAVILMGGFLVCTTASFGKPEYTKATKKPCAYCHVDAKNKPKELKAPGKYYEEHKSLDGYVEK